MLRLDLSDSQNGIPECILRHSHRSSDEAGQGHFNSPERQRGDPCVSSFRAPSANEHWQRIR